MKLFSSPADLAATVGSEIGTGDWLAVEQRRIDRFAEATGDHQWIHTDPERAAAGPFAATIAHGFLTLSLLPTLCQQVYQVQGVRMGVNYGLNKVRFPAPVRVGSQVRARVRTAQAEEIPGGHEIVLSVTIELQGSAKPACVADLVARLYV